LRGSFVLLILVELMAITVWAFFHNTCTMMMPSTFLLIVYDLFCNYDFILNILYS
jgi:hypothetical protein